MSTKQSRTGSAVGDQIVAGFQEMAAYIRGEIECESYELDLTDEMTPARIQRIRKSVAHSTKDFEHQFGVKARTMENYESGRREPDAAMLFLLWSLEQEPETARRVAAHHQQAA
jgi:putative transcriptional regulator